MTDRTKTVIAASLLALSLTACGQKAEPPKKDEVPALPQPKTGDAIDAAAEEAMVAEDAMVAAEKATDAKADEAKSKASSEPKAAEKSDADGAKAKTQ